MQRLILVHRQGLIIHSTRHAIRSRRTDATPALGGCVAGAVLGSEDIATVERTADVVDECPGTTRVGYCWDGVGRLGMAVEFRVNSSFRVCLEGSPAGATYLVVETAIVVV